MGRRRRRSVERLELPRHDGTPPPGPGAALPRVTLVTYDRDRFAEKQGTSIEGMLPPRGTPGVTWLNIDGAPRQELLDAVGRHYGIHPLALEDILHADQRPKFEDFGEYAFLVVKMLHYDEQAEQLTVEQVSLILGNGFVLSFQGNETNDFDAVRDRLRAAKGVGRQSGADHLAYTLIDTVIDGYFVVLEQIGERIEQIEDALVTDPTKETLHGLHHMKQEMLFLRKAVWPLREVINGLQRTDLALLTPATRVYIRDAYDHTVQVIDTIEIFRDMMSGMVDIYLSSISNRMNEVMKVLTIISTIFIPLTFVVGVYGMNFQHMPELSWRWGYGFAWLVMIGITTVQIVMFKKRKWL
jgi:magnesium transporter